MCIPFHLDCLRFFSSYDYSFSFHALANYPLLLKYSSVALCGSSKQVKLGLACAPSFFRNYWKAFIILVWCLMGCVRNFS